MYQTVILVALLLIILWRQNTMSEALARLTAEVQETRTVVASAAALIGGLAAQIRDAIGDEVALNALADQLDADQATLSQAIADNTPATAPTLPVDVDTDTDTGEDLGSDENEGAAEATNEDAIAARQPREQE